VFFKAWGLFDGCMGLYFECVVVRGVGTACEFIEDTFF